MTAPRPIRVADRLAAGDPTGSVTPYHPPPGADPRNPYGTTYVASLCAMVDSGAPLGTDDGFIERTAIDGHVRHWKPRGAPCAWCGAPVPQESRYASYCHDRCRCRAGREKQRWARAAGTA